MSERSSTLLHRIARDTGTPLVELKRIERSMSHRARRFWRVAQLQALHHRGKADEARKAIATISKHLGVVEKA